MRKQPEMTEQTKQAFIEAFCELYCRKPIQRISIKELSERAGYNRSTFYQYFSDIYDVLSSMENEFLDYVRVEIGAEGPMTGPADLNRILCLFEEKELYLRALLGEYGNLHFIGQVKKEIAQKIETTQIPNEDPEIPYILEFLLSSVVALFQLWIRREKDISIDGMIELEAKLYESALRLMEEKRKAAVCAGTEEKRRPDAGAGDGGKQESGRTHRNPVNQRRAAETAEEKHAE